MIHRMKPPAAWGNCEWVDLLDEIAAEPALQGTEVHYWCVLDGDERRGRLYYKEQVVELGQPLSHHFRPPPPPPAWDTGATGYTGPSLSYTCPGIDFQTFSSFDPSVGTKFDDGKPDISLVEPKFIIDMAKVLTMGAQKYDRDNWKNGLAPERIYAALQRHLLAYWSGEKTDPESGISHLAHVAVNTMFLSWYDDQN